MQTGRKYRYSFSLDENVQRLEDRRVTGREAKVRAGAKEDKRGLGSPKS